MRGGIHLLEIEYSDSSQTHSQTQEQMHRGMEKEGAFHFHSLLSSLLTSDEEHLIFIEDAMCVNLLTFFPSLH